MYKKIIIIILSLFLITGCKQKSMIISNAEIDTIVENVAVTNDNLYNVNSKGYRYYLPRNFRILKEDNNNQILISEHHKYYLYVDLISYKNKTINKYKMGPDAIYGTDFNYNDKYGYIEINKKNSYFYIKMMYNYSMIEVAVEDEYIKPAIMYMSAILSSIKYNDSVIKNVIGENVLEAKESKYEIFTPVVPTEKKNFLEYVEQYDTYYDNTQQIIDTDLIN